MHRWPLSILALAAFGAPAPSTAAVPSIETFAARPQIQDVSVSPDGRYLALIETVDDRAGVFVKERGTSTAPVFAMAEPEHFRFRWCKWATNTRLLCSFLGMESGPRGVYALTRLVAVDADGRNMKVLVQNSSSAQGQFQDRILHWHPGPPNTVLLEADEGIDASGTAPGVGAVVIGNIGTHALPAVFELDIVTGRMKVRQHARSPIRHWTADPHGEVRLGWGLDGADVSYYARLAGERDWRRLAKFEAFTRGDRFEPIAISADDPNKAYATAPSEGRSAVWLVDLRDTANPELVFAHPLVDVEHPLLGSDGRLLGVYYDTDYPNVFYTDERARAVIDAVKPALPGRFSVIASETPDHSIFVIRSFSDVEPTGFHIYDSSSKRLLKIGDPSAGLDPTTLSRMSPIRYAARDGTEVQGYLSVPRGSAGKHLPLVVLPHGGPIHRDSWGYSFLEQFLTSRGYAVLQMNFRGSAGYGSDWFFAAHQDWGGLTYDDVVDATRWAIKEGIADPQRVCIVGWSFGGYIALVGGQRDAELFRCAVSIAGISDLGLLEDEEFHFLNYRVTKKQIGTDSAKLRRDSPRLHAADFKVPVLMVHGTRDAQVALEQSEVMDAALRRANKPDRLVVIKDGDHSLNGKSFRVTLLRELEAFLGQNIGAAGGTH